MSHGEHRTASTKREEDKGKKRVRRTLVGNKDADQRVLPVTSDHGKRQVPS